MGLRSLRPGRHRIAILASLLAGAIAQAATAGRAAAADASGRERLEALVMGYAQPKIVQPGLAVGPHRLELGRMEITLEEGRIYPIRSGPERWMGFVAQGIGSYRLIPRNPAETARIRRVLNEQEARVFDHDGALHGRLSRVVAITNLDRLEQPEMVPGSNPGSEQDAADRKWRLVDEDQILETIRGRGFDTTFAVARLNGGEYSNVYIEGPTGELRLISDRTFVFSDRLWFSRPKPGRQGSRFLDLTPDPWSDDGARYLARLKDLSLNVQIRDKGSAAITAEELCAIGRDRVRILPFMLGDTANIRRVGDDQGHDLEFVRGPGEIFVDLGGPLQRDSTVRLTFETDAEPVHDGGVVALRYENFFFPVPGGADLASFTSSLKVRSPKPLRPVVPGRLIALREEGDSYVLEAKNTVPKTWLSILAGDFTTEEKIFGGVTVRAHLSGWRRVRGIEGTSTLAGRMVEALQEMLGPYPYESLEIVEMRRQGFVAAGLPGMVWLTPLAFRQRSPLTPVGPLVLWPERVMAHEIAHQWFGIDIMKGTPDNDTWLIQSFADYMSGAAMDALSPEEREDEGFSDVRCEWKRGTPPGTRRHKASLMEEGSAGSPADIIVMTRGPMVIHMLRNLAGDERFFRITQRFLRESADRGATTARLQSISEEVLETDMGWFFDQWVRAGGVPRVRISQRVEPLEAGRALLSGRAEQPAGPAFKRLRIPVTVDIPGRGRGTLIVAQDQPVTEFRFELDGVPESVQFDPDCDTLAWYKLK